ncbi:alpha/beta hydrolase [Ramlibacter sp. AW1]|uniref:Alpha/beta hydrolase n=1 Tax=Ramlibacter aurantiacus TaxID=2801330 RepID=A0A936ZV68_9BURK|nr:alpha/beta hydrolase [Ramlibacter aurantiacus]MBL0423191.1 alpha/beta hydrolase [Ramlibacter aurantiacus]
MEHTVIDGVALEVQRVGSSGAPAHAPLVFLHEGLGSVAMWRDWPARLCHESGRQGIVYSRRGYGASDGVPDVRGKGRLGADYLHREALEVLPALLARLGLQSPVLVGHSDGGSIALIHAAEHPVAACVALAPHVIVEDVSVRSIEQARDAFLGGDLRERLGRFHRDVDGAFWQWNDIWLSREFRDFDIRPLCRRITAPVLAIQGEQDPYGTLRQIDEIAPTAGRLQKLVLPDCGHSPHRDQPDRATAAIRDFLQTID